MYCKDKQVQNPDSEDSLNILKDCLKFIFNFCNEEKITLTQYKNYTGVDASEAIPIIFTHLKNHKINFYLLHALDVGSVIKYVVRHQDKNGGIHLLLGNMFRRLVPKRSVSEILSLKNASRFFVLVAKKKKKR